MYVSIAETLLVLLGMILCLANTDGSQYFWASEVHSAARENLSQTHPLFFFFFF